MPNTARAVIQVSLDACFQRFVQRPGDKAFRMLVDVVTCDRLCRIGYTEAARSQEETGQQDKTSDANNAPPDDATLSLLFQQLNQT